MNKMPSKAEETEELAERLGVAVAELPDAIMKMKADLDQKIRDAQKFAKMFGTQPKNRAMRRAQRFNHSRLHG